MSGTLAGFPILPADVGAADPSLSSSYATHLRAPVALYRHQSPQILQSIEVDTDFEAPSGYKKPSRPRSFQEETPSRQKGERRRALTLNEQSKHRDLSPPSNSRRRRAPSAQETRQAAGMPPKGAASQSDSKKTQSPPLLTLTQPKDRSEEEDDEDEDEVSGSTSDAEEGGSESAVKSAAERLAEKRRMKRFRLTHSQTRYLMNEFARQPNPDAAHREKLSGEIPGLSPRQVQVWFQNRRAKMKRLTGDDQDRMVRSRALPTGFDLSQGLQAATTTFSSQPSPAFSDARNVPPINMTLVYRNPSFSMSGAGDSSNVSPVSSINEGTVYSGNQSPIIRSSRHASPFRRSTSVHHQTPSALGQEHTPEMTRARSSSLANLSPTTSLQQFPAFGFGSAHPSYEGLQESYQMLESQADPQLGDLAQLHLNPLPSGAMPLTPDPHDIQGQMRRYSSSMTMPPQQTDYADLDPTVWSMQVPFGEAPHPGYQTQAEHQTQRESHAAAGGGDISSMIPTSVAPRDLFRSDYMQDQMPTHYTYSTEATSGAGASSVASYPSGGPNSPVQYQTAFAAPPQASDISSPEGTRYSSRAQSYSQSPSYPSYYSPPQQ